MRVTEIDDPPFDLDRHAPFFWTAIANRWTAACSREFQRLYGVGVVEWRILVTLAVRESGATSLEAAKLAALDTAAANRSMRGLAAAGYVVELPPRPPGRSKPFRMTAEGEQLFNRMRGTADALAEALLGPFDSAEMETLLALLSQIYERLPAIGNARMTDA